MSARRRRLALLVALSVALVTAGSPALATGDGTVPEIVEPPTQEGRSVHGSRIGLPLLPDTQFYSRYDTPDTGMQLTERYGSNPFETQARWISQNRDALAAPLAIHVGDVVDQAGVPQEWESARRSLQPFFDADMPFSILAGNHDLAPGDPFARMTADAEFDERSTLRGRDGSGFHEFHVVEAEGQEFLQLALSWDASPQDLAWAQGVIDAHPTLPVVLSTHRNLDVEGDGATPKRNDYSEYLWDELVARNDQIFLVISGHHHGASVEVRQNDAGHDVVHVLTDYQMSYQGGNGYMNLLELDLTDGYIDLATFSPWLQEKPRETLTSFDEPILDGPHQEWSVPFDFTERFAGFRPYFRPGTPDETDLTETAKALATTHWTPPTSAEHPVARDAQDFPAVAGTLAHWRPGQSSLRAGEAVPVGAAITDATGKAPLTRGPLDAPGVVGAQEGDVVASDDHHPLSADTGSLEFRRTDRAANRLSFFTTAQDAAVNDATFEEGYTFEAFVKVDPEWTTANSWMGAIARGGDRTALGDTEGEVEASPATLALSSLREFQWNVRPRSGDPAAASAWSHEIPRGQWMHVAIVNDPASRTTTMYVEGAPVLRNQVDMVGIGTTGEPWVLGAGLWEGALTDGWLGSIGEVRLVDHPLAPEQWLTARAAGSEGQEPGGDVPVTAQIPDLGGEGQGPDGSDPQAPGALALTVADGGLELAEARHHGSHLSLVGALPTVTVTDSRPASAGWTVTGSSSDLTSGTAALRAGNLGWEPFVVRGDAVPGSAVRSTLAGGSGLGTPSALGTGDGTVGSTELGADVRLDAPVDTTPGTYTGAMTVSLFPQD